MTLPPTIAAALDTGDLVLAERLARRGVEQDSGSAVSMEALGAVLRAAGRDAEAIAAFEAALRQDPGRLDSQLGLALSQRKARLFAAAAASFLKHAASPGADAAPSLEEAAACTLQAGDRPGALEILAGAGLAPAGVALDLDAVLAAFQEQRLAQGQYLAMMRVLASGDGKTALFLDLAAWKSGKPAQRRSVARRLPNKLLLAGRIEDAKRVFQEAIAAGFEIEDFRPKIIDSALAARDPDLAARLYARDRERFLAGAAGHAARAAAPGRAASARHALTGSGDPVGCVSVVFTASIAHVTVGARYRFEYGARPDQLDGATPWRAAPPPLTGRSVHRVYRHAGDWLPTSIGAAWVSDTMDPDPGLLIKAPFAKDRNQLNGIGAHDMVMGISWIASRATRGAPPDDKPPLPVGGGVIDLRDARLSLTLRGQTLEQHGGALHFWIAHSDTDAEGPFVSQWALTAQPIPDNVLARQQPGTTVLNLVNDPRAWTYTGNNPIEQGDLARRYRRVPLDLTLSENNAAFVLIFAFADVRYPPSGGLVFYRAELAYRDHSVLSPAAGAELVERPAGGDDACRLTCGVRGDDAALWTSDPFPSYPLQFTWALPRPVALTRLQINQHPYLPAKEVEVSVTDPAGARTTLWTGILPEARPDRGEPPGFLKHLPDGSTASAITLRILSGYHAEHVGLDGIELYGAGALFAGDGEPCSVSAETGGFAPGDTVHYRVVLEDGDVAMRGATRSVVLPMHQAPLLESATPWIRAANPSCYLVRANAMGLETKLWGELTLADGSVHAAPTVSLGCQPTGRHIAYVPGGLPDQPGLFRLRACNSAGEASLPAPWPCGQSTG